METSFVSVVIVTFNRKIELTRALRSVFRQSYLNKEVIVVDNASTDETTDMIKKDFPQVKLLKLDYNMGCPEGRNVAIRHCKGDFIFFLDDDAWYEDPGFISMVMSRFRELPEEVVVIMPEIMEWDESRWRKRIKITDERELYTFSGGVSAVRKRVFNDIGDFPSTVYGAEEKYLSIKMFEKGLRIFFLPQLLVHHKPSIIRDRGQIIYYKVRNDLAWVWTFCPRWLLLPHMILKWFTWFIFSIQKKVVLNAVRGFFVGIIVGKDIIRKERNSIDTITYVQYLRKRRSAVRVK